jgi:hypothetical protein
MIDRQHERLQNLADCHPEDYTTALGAQMLRVALDLDELVAGGMSFGDALADMRRTQAAYDPTVFAALERLVAELARADGRPERLPNPATLPYGNSYSHPESPDAMP